MFATFVIGLREGLEAALIVGIIAAFLKRSGPPGALRQMWAGVVVAVLLCLAGGIALQMVSSGLPQRQQEMLECVVAAVAVVMVSYMILWMRANSRGLKGELERVAGGALATGSAFALVAMAFLAVLREGLETAVFLLAAFQSSGSAMLAVVGAALGIAVAVVLGWLIYRGGVRLNLSKFFRITGVVLVLVAAGLVAKSLRAAYEAGWLTIGQQHPLDLTSIARPGSVQASLLTGVLGISAQPALIEILGYLLYLVPMMAVVLWPPKRTLSRRAAGRLLTALGASAAVVAVLLVVTAPAAPSTAGTASVPVTVAVGETVAPDGSSTPPTTIDGTATVTVLPGGRLEIALTAGSVALDGRTAGTLVGHLPVDGRPAVQYRGAAVTGPVDPTTVPTTVTGAQLAAVSGRLPIGLRAADAATAMPAAFTDTWRPTVSIDPASGAVLDASITLTRTVQVTTAAGLTLSGGVLGGAEISTTADARAALAVAVTDHAAAVEAHEIRGQVLPLLLGLFAVVLLAFGLPRLRRRAADRPPPTDAGGPSTPPDPEPSVAAPSVAAPSVAAPSGR